MKFVCDLCPRECLVERNIDEVGNGFCKLGSEMLVARSALHHGEEPCISGSNGSGTIFFSGCNLGCVFCQNYKISHENYGINVDENKLLDLFINLVDKGAHNINLVNPTPHILHIIPVLKKFKRLFPYVPIVYNSSGYEKPERLSALSGLVDVYLPDIKFFDGKISLKYAYTSDYFTCVIDCVFEMLRQVGTPVFDENGIITKGLIIRHLVLPGHTSDSIKIIDWIATNIPDAHVSLMCQYIPCGKAPDFPELNRRLSKREYLRVSNHLFAQPSINGYIQEHDSANEEYIPDFNLEGCK